MENKKQRRNAVGVFVIAFFTISLTLFTTGCSKNIAISDEDTIIDMTNPFETEASSGAEGGTLEHGPREFIEGEAGKRAPYIYTGGEFKLPYMVKGTGKGKDVGFLIYIGGIAQPYKTDITDENYKYMHMLDLKKDGEEAKFNFIFTPITGNKGDELVITIVSIHNPKFIPDMQVTSSYGGYHSALEFGAKIVFKEDAVWFDFSTIVQKKCLQNVSMSKKAITKDFLSSLSAMGKIKLEDLNERIFSKIYYDNKEQMDNIKISKTGSVHLTYMLCGIPGVKYKSTVYVNHQAMTSSDATSFESTLSKGDISIIEMDINVEKFDDLSTVYIMSVPINASDYPNAVIIVDKSMSILFYK